MGKVENVTGSQTRELDDAFVRTLGQSSGKQQFYYDRGHHGLVLCVGARTKTWLVRYSFKGKVRWRRIGAYDPSNRDRHMTLAKARAEAVRFKDNKAAILEGEAANAAAASAPPPTPLKTFRQIGEDYFKRVVEANGLRSEGQIRSYLDKVIYPAWADRAFVDIRRGDVTTLLDTVADERGPRAADMVLAFVRQIMQWHQSRTEDYTSPIVRGMQRTKPAERRRKRILNQDEIRVMWHACGKLGTFGALVKILFLTGQRRSKVATMMHTHVADGVKMEWGTTENGVWSIATEAREKGNGEHLKLPKLALDIIRSQPVIKGNPYVFPSSRRRYNAAKDNTYPNHGSFSAFGQGKEELDALMRETLPDLPQWQLHDLRRTARSLMSRANVRSEIAERVLGHAIVGVEAVYDLHDYFDQRAEALQALADLVSGIVKAKPNARRRAARSN